MCANVSLEFLPQGDSMDRTEPQPLTTTQGADPRTLFQSCVQFEVFLRSLRCFQGEDSWEEHWFLPWICFFVCFVLTHLNHAAGKPSETPGKAGCSWLEHTSAVRSTEPNTSHKMWLLREALTQTSHPIHCAQAKQSTTSSNTSLARGRKDKAFPTAVSKHSSSPNTTESGLH